MFKFKILKNFKILFYPKLRFSSSLSTIEENKELFIRIFLKSIKKTLKNINLFIK